MENTKILCAGDPPPFLYYRTAGTNICSSCGLCSLEETKPQHNVAKPPLPSGPQKYRLGRGQIKLCMVPLSGSLAVKTLEEGEPQQPHLVPKK